MIRFASASIKEVIRPDSQGNIRTARKMVASVDPNYLYAVLSGLHGDEPNQNGDYFAWDELVKEHHTLKGKKVYATWVGKPNLVNHDALRVVGEIIDSWPVEQEKSIDMLVKVARKHDWLVKPIEKGEIVDCSMGCSVAWSKCSECDHIAHDESEWCLVAGTEILNGAYRTVEIQDVKVGDTVITHTGKAQKVTKLYQRNVNEDVKIIKVAGDYRALTVTANHPMFVMKAADIHCRRDTKQSVCAPGKFFVCTKAGSTCQHRVAEKATPQFMPAGDVVEGDWLLTPVISEEIPLSKELDNASLVSILGWYLAEGNIGHKNQANQSVQLSISKQEELLTQRIITAVQKVANGYTPRVHDRDGVQSRQIVISDGGALAEVCNGLCGEYAKEKRLSPILLTAPKETLKTLLLAYLDGDGYVVNGHQCVETASKTLAHQLVLLCDKLGLHASVLELENEPTALVPAEGLTIYRVSIAKTKTNQLYNAESAGNNLCGRYFTYAGSTYRLRKVTSVTSERFEGPVYNLEVENDNSYVANGVAVHNCDHLNPTRKALKGRTNPVSGKMVYEDNRDVTGVELSWITFGEGADSKAERKVILASKEIDGMLDDKDIADLAATPSDAPKGERFARPPVERVASIRPFTSTNGGGEPVVGGNGSTAAADAMLGGLVTGLVTAVKLESQLGGMLTPEAIMKAFDNGDISKKDMVHLAAKMGLGVGLEPKAAFEAIERAANPAAAAPVVEKPVAAQAVQTPEKPESAATEKPADMVKKQVPVTSDEESAVMAKAQNTTELVSTLKSLIAALTKSAEQSLDDGLENAKSPVTPAKPDSLKAPNPEIKDNKALDKALDKGQEQAKDKVERQPEEEEIKTIDSGGKSVEKLDQDPQAQPDPNPGTPSKNPNNVQEAETLKTQKGVDGLTSKTEMPKSSALSVSLVEDAKKPAQSYWRVAIGDEPVFAVTAEKAFGEELTPARLYQFKSAAYGEALRTAIRNNGLAKTLSECFGGEKGAVVIAKADRVAQLDMGMLPKMPEKEATPDNADVLDLPSDEGAPPPMMGIDKDVAQDIEEGGKKGKSPFVDMLVDLIAPVIAKEDKWTLDDVINELSKMAKGEGALSVFQGKLEKKIEDLKSRKDKKEDKGEDKEEKDEEKAEKHEESESKEEEAKEEKKENPFAKKEEKSERELKLEAALKEVTALLPQVAAKLQKSEDAEVERHLKIRAVQTRKLALRMAQLNMIEDDGIDAYAATLAKKSDEEIAAVVDTVERAEAALPRLEAARRAKVGEKIASLGNGAPIRSTLPGGALDKTSQELEAAPRKGSLIDWSRPPQVDENQRK